MQLMLKPSLKCQFKCDFCSAACYKQKDMPYVDQQMVEDIKKIGPDNIILTGGDPLLLPQKYFTDLLSIDSKITLSLTTNLWDFWIHPDKWKDLLSNPRIMVCTSFQYGNRRKKPDGSPYTEEDFIKVEEKFNSMFGYHPSFISVISRENEDRAIDHVLLAKKLGTTVKLNGMSPVGLSKEYYPRYKMLDIYFKIIDMSLEQYEDNVRLRDQGTCPFNTTKGCFQFNRSIVAMPDGTRHYSYCEDMAFNVLYYDNLEKLDNKDYNIVDETISSKCLSCELFRFCNGCKLHRQFAKNDKDYCFNMSKYIQQLKKYGFSI